MTYIRTDGSVAIYDHAASTARYRSSMGKYYCVYCDRTGVMVAYPRHCKSMMHINAMDNYLKHNPAPPPVIYRVKDLPPAPKKAPAAPKKTIKEVPPANTQFTISLKPLSNICITNTDPKALLKPLPLR